MLTSDPMTYASTKDQATMLSWLESQMEKLQICVFVCFFVVVFFLPGLYYVKPLW